MKKILIIEDNTEVRENLAEILELSDYQVETAENGKIGVAKAMSNPPDLILCDVMMPELDGFGVLKILEKKPETVDIPFIFLTAKAEKADFRKGMNLGADDYLTKPFDDVELLDAIEMRLKKSERVQKTTDRDSGAWTAFAQEAKGQQALTELAAGREERCFAKKEFLFREGDQARYLFLLNEGQVKTYCSNEWGKEYINQLYRKRDFLGYEALLQDKPYAESAVATEHTVVQLIPKQDFLDLLYQNPDFSANFIKLLAKDVVEKEQQLLSLAYDSIRKRVAEALLRLAVQQPEAEHIRIRREDLAALVGTAKESVIRTLSDFKGEGLIAVEGGAIKLLQQQKLEDLPG